MKPPLRIAILECDTPLAETRGKYGGYCGVFKALLAAGADSLEQPDVISSEKGLEISCFDVVDKMEYPDLEEVDAVLITGSRECLPFRNMNCYSGDVLVGNASFVLPTS